MAIPYARTLLAGSVLVVAGIGALHLPIARPLLARMGVSCPVDSVSAVQVETMHRVAVEALRGGAPAPSLDAFGLVIGTSREDEVRHWTAARDLTCQFVVRGMRYLSCVDVPSIAVGRAAGEAIQDLTFSFDSQKMLVGVDALRSGLNGQRAGALGSSIEQRLRDVLGAPTAKVGTFDASYLEAGAFRTSYVTYTFSDCLVTLTAVHMPGRGTALREQYVGVHPSAAAVRSSD